MPTGSRKSAGTIDIKTGSILLLFTDHQAKIVRDWQFVKKHGGAAVKLPHVESASAELPI